MKFITGNQNKFNETKAILGIDLEMLNLDLPEIQSENPQQVALYKANYAKDLGYDDFIVEDSGLLLGDNEEVGALIKWFANGRIVKAFINEEVRAVSVFVLCKNGKLEVFMDTVYGKIVFPRGENGFGWDSIFEFKDRTFAELSTLEKNEVSPRAGALKDLKEYLTKTD
jgi:XTP/dITP diphosphohydrolase